MDDMLHRYGLAASLLCLVPATALAQSEGLPKTLPSANAAPAQATCNPPCRSAFTCVEGRCVSLCNPPCESDKVCSDLGTCIAKNVAPAAALPGQPRQHPPERADPGWARGAGVFGVVNAGLIGLTLAAGLSVDDRDTEIALGASIVGYGALTAPLVAMGGGSGRNHPAVRGSPGMRTVAWIGYVAFVVDGVVLVAAAAEGEDIPEPVAVSAVLLGISVELAFAADAFATASQAERVGRSADHGRSTQIQPYVGLNPERGGGYNGVVGIHGSLW